MNKYIEMGVTKRAAKRSVFIEKGWWYLAKVLATNVAMSNKWLHDQGLVCIKDIWSKIQYPDNPKLSFQN